MIRVTILTLLIVAHVRGEDYCDANVGKAPEPYCDNGQMKQQTIIIRNVNDTCLLDYKIKLITPSCAAKETEIGVCQKKRYGQFYCMAEDIFHKTEVDANCRCIDIPVKVSRTCCCPEPTNYTTCDPHTSIQETVSTVYELINADGGYSCKSIETRISKKLEFQTEYKKTIGVCDSNGFRVDVTTKRFLDGCKVKEAFDRSETKPCACYPASRTVTSCVGDSYIVTKVYENILNCGCGCTCICEERIFSSSQTSVECSQPTEERSECTYPGNKRRVVQTIYQLKNCQCKKNVQESFEKCTGCDYKVIAKTEGKCCGCQTKTVVTTYIDTDCNEKQKKEEVLCVCSDTPPKNRKTCENGISYSITYFYKMDTDKYACITKETKVEIPIICKKTQVTTSACNAEKRYYSKRTTIEYKVDTETCTCKPNIKTELIICACQSPEITKQVCERNDHLVRTTATYTLNVNSNRCDKQTNEEDLMVACFNTRPDEVVNINRCKKMIRTYSRSVINCRCVLRPIVEYIVECCLEQPSTKVTCENNDIKATTTTTYKVSDDRQRCEPVKSVVKQKIVCQEYWKVSKSHCINGKYTITKTQYGVKNCKCVVVKVHKKPVTVGCYSKKPSVNTVCDGDKWIITTTSWKIKDCHCTSSSQSIYKRLICDWPFHKVSKCDRKTGKVTIRIKYYVVVKCQCVAKVIVRQVKCRCWRPDRIEKLRCVGRNRIVNLLRYKEVNKRCQWIVIKTELEDCRCPKDRQIKRCKKNKFVITQTTSYSLQLKHLRLPVNRCVARIREKSDLVVCKTDYTYHTPCKNFKQSVISCSYTRQNCRCVKTCNTDCVRACDCRQRNRCERQCVDNVKYKICYHYYHNGAGCGFGDRKKVSKCAESKFTEVIQINCGRPIRPLTCSACTIYQRFGVYRRCVRSQITKRNCNCKLQIKTTLRLCRCMEKISSQPICRENKWVTRITKFARHGQECVPRYRDYETEIECEKPYLITKDLPCSTVYTMVYHQKQNCICVKKSTTKTNSKCCIRPVVRKICTKKNWLFVEHRREQRDSSVKLFPELSDSPTATVCEQVTKSWTKPVICDKDSIEIWCNIKTKRLRTIHYHFVKPHCRCVRQKLVLESKCHKCPPDVKHRGKCGPSDSRGFGYLDVTITTYRIRGDNTCRKLVKHSREVCRCTKPIKNTYCIKGHKIFQQVTFVIRSVPPCQRVFTEIRQSVYCYNFGKPNPWSMSEIDKCVRPGQYTVATYERYEFVDVKCECVLKRKTVKTEICCAPCRKFRKCVANTIVVTTVCEFAKGLKCVKRRRTNRIAIDCPHPIKRLRGSPVKCVQRYSLTVFINIRCRCVRRTTSRSKLVCCFPSKLERTQCENNRWKITTTNFYFVKGKCLSDVSVEYEEVPMCQLDEETFKDTPIDRCTFWRLYFVKKIVNCKYVDSFVSKEKLEKCCAPPKTSVTCKNNKMQVFTTRRYTLIDFQCVLQTCRKEVKTQCRQTVRRESKPTGKCTFDDIFYGIAIKNCKCVEYVKRVEHKESSCCGRKPYSTRKCDATNGIITTLSYTYRLVHYKCVKIVTTSTERVNCDVKNCHTSIGPCINHNNVVKVYCLTRVKCKCVRKLFRKGNQCCKPESYQWRVIGACDTQTMYRTIKYFAFRLDQVVRICKPVLIKVQRRICLCTKPTVSVRCIDDIFKKVVTTTYELNEEKDTCVMTVNEQVKSVRGCGKTETTVRIVSQHCNRRSGWNTITTEYVRAKNCKCIKTRRTKKCPCICDLAFPPRHKSFCKSNKFNVLTTTYAVCTGCTVQLIVTVKITTDVHCQRIVIEKGNCVRQRDGFAVSVRFVLKVQYVLVNCRCVRKVLSRRKEHCECLKRYRTEICLVSKKRITSVHFKIQNGRCRKVQTSKLVIIPCNRRVRIIRLPCRHNKYTIITITFYHHHCRCVFRTSTRKCHCKCPNTTIRKRCTKKYWIDVITTRWKMVNCRCRKYVCIKQHAPKCPKLSRKIVGKCIKKGNRGYRKIITRELRRIRAICKCLVKEKHRFSLCWCKDNLEIRKVCVHNVLVKEKWKWVLDRFRGRCVWVKIDSTVVIIPRPKTIVTYTCNRKTGRDILTTVSYYLENCVYRPKVTKSHGFCKCPRQWKLIHKGKCPRPRICIRTDIYSRKQLRNRRCVNVRETKTVRCCCYPKLKIRTYCRDNKRHVSTTRYLLIHQKCIPKRSVTVSSIKCSTVIIVRKSKCNSHGFKIITKFRHVLRHCRCVLEKIAEFKCRCRCGKERVAFFCNAARGIETKTVTIFLKLRCKCVAQITLTQRVIKCRNEHVYVSPCTYVRGTNYSIRRFVTTSYHVNNKCVCVRRQSVKRQICFCQRNKTVTRTCDKQRHVMTSRITFTILRNHACVRKSVIKRHVVRCGSRKWVLIGDSGCRSNYHYGRRLLSYVRQKPVGCHCTQEEKTKLCDCICTGPARRSVCYNNVIKHIHYIYQMVNCKCVVSTKIRWAAIRCARRPPTVTPCRPHYDGTHRIYTIRHHVSVRHCKCVTRNTVEWVICKCPSMFTIRRCNVLRNVFVYTRVWFVMQPRQCKRQMEIITKSIPCDTTPKCTVHQKCRNRRKDRQVHRCIFRKLSNCRCKVTVKMIKHRCRCRRTNIHIGPCSKKTCFKKITITKYYLVVFSNNRTKCVPYKSHRRERCACCTKTIRTIKCHNNRLIDTTVSYIFNKRSKQCDKVLRILNVTPKCSPRKEIYSTKCHRRTHCTRRVRIISRRLVNCRCRVTKREYNCKCCCPRNYSTVQCIKHQRIKTTYHRFALRHCKCHRTSVVDVKIVRCPPPSSKYITPCNYVTRVKILQTISYRLRHCRCIRFVKRQDVICSCPPSYTSQTCIRTTGIIRRILTSYHLDSVRHICIKHQAVSNQKVFCNTKHRTRCGRCRITYLYGWFRICVTNYEIRHGCECVPRSFKKWRLCYCPRPIQYSVCNNNVIITMQKYFEVVRVRHHKYSSICRKRTRRVNSQPVTCPRETVTSGRCVNRVRVYRKRYYVIIRCVCILRTKIYKVVCACPSFKMIQKSCLRDMIWKKIVRHYRLGCHVRHGVPRCNCIQFNTVHMSPVYCRRRHHIIGRCIRGARIIVFIRYVAKNCRCISVRRHLRIDCKECVKDASFCHKVKRLGLCKKILYKLYMCQFTCGYCERCPKKCVTTPISRCICKTVNGLKICTRKVKITTHKIIHRKCVLRTFIRHLLCSCLLHYSKHKCQEYRRQGRCKEREIMKKCEYICNDNCQRCQGCVKHRRCVQAGKHKGTYRIVVVSLQKRCNACLARTTITYEGTCQVCDKRHRYEVTDCINGVRYVLTRFVKKEGRVCVNKVTRVAYSCHDCSTQVETKIGACVHGHRTVVTEFWTEIKKCCRKQIVSNVYSCNKRCSSVSYAKSQCLNNKLIYVRIWKSGKNCATHRVSEMRSCLPPF